MGCPSKDDKTSRLKRAVREYYKNCDCGHPKKGQPQRSVTCSYCGCGVNEKHAYNCHYWEVFLGKVESSKAEHIAAATELFGLHYREMVQMYLKLFPLHV